MGSEIAQAAAAGGVEVVLVDADPAALERGAAHVAEIGARRVARGRMSAAQAEAIVGRITPTDDLARLAACDLAIEAVPEILDLKREVFRRLDAALPPAALLASNTSGLPISALARETGRPDRVLGLHFFDPASVMRLVEVVQGERTSGSPPPPPRRSCEPWARRRCGCRSARASWSTACSCARWPRPTGWPPRPAPTGPPRTGRSSRAAPRRWARSPLGDLIGLDTLAHLRRHLEEAYGERFGDGGAVDREVAAGRLGAKSGAGFHDGDARERAADEPGRAVAERYYLAALDEARRCVEEVVAAAADIDPAMRYGCGWSEGPLEWGRERGLADAVRGN